MENVQNRIFLKGIFKMVTTITGGDNAAKRDIKEGLAKLNRIEQDILADLITRRIDFFKAFLFDYDYFDEEDLRKVLDLTNKLKFNHFSK